MKSIQNTTGRVAPNRAFTIVELLVAIGVLALVSIGLSVIFGSVGDAVTEGRRASEMNQAAQRIETQIRADLERLTRDGYLVIAQTYAMDESQTATKVQLSPRDREARLRRTDEIMFFARGDFISKRPPLVSGVQATSNEAAIYYGVGQKRVPNLEVDPNRPENTFFNPFPADPNLGSTRRRPYDPMLGVVEPSGAPANPNRYARDWSLLRQTTLLATPKIASAVPAEVYGVDRADEIRIGSRLLQDSERQIALQPAARSIFNSLGWTDLNSYARPIGAPNGIDGLSRWWIGDIAEFPGSLTSPLQLTFPAWRSSGVVDIAHGNIATIRRQIMALAATNTPTTNYYPPGNYRPNNPRPANRGQTADQFNQDWLDPAVSPSQQEAASFSATSHQVLVRDWALDSLPSLWAGGNRIAGVRYEDTPTRLVFEGDEFPDSDEGRLGRAIAEANQEMLGAQIFVPRVTEFVVEWSFGYVDNSLRPASPDFKKMIWYGLPRATRDFNGDGVINLTDHRREPEVVPYFTRNRIQLPPDRRSPQVDDVARVNIMYADGGFENPHVAVFGITDPNGTAGNPSDDTTAPWPKFIRITMSLADPKEQDQERTFQFVFAVPGEQG